MAYCEQCKGEHKPKRKIPASHLVLAWYAALYLWEQGAPGFPDAFRQLVPDARDSTDENLRAWLGDSVQCLKDLLSVFRDPETGLLRIYASEFLVLRDTGLSDAARVVTAVSSEPLCHVAIGFSADEDGMTAVNWLVSSTDAHALADGLRERLGDPDMDIAADRQASEQMAEAFEEHAVHTHPD